VSVLDLACVAARQRREDALEAAKQARVRAAAAAAHSAERQRDMLRLRAAVDAYPRRGRLAAAPRVELGGRRQGAQRSSVCRPGSRA